MNKTISNVIDTDYHGYAMYVLEHRAIPSAIDGLKPTHRKLLYSMLNDYKGKKTKCNDLGSISKHNYHHGEASAMGAVVTLTADYNNNVPLFTGHGNFGSRLIQEAAAPRYIFASLNNNFYDYFSDFEVCSPHKDKDNPEPQTYLPVIPWVLVNGIEGIAVGFACKFMPHSPKDLAKACIQYLNGKKIPNLIPSFPQFTGEVVEDTESGTIGKYLLRGTVNRTKRNTWEISEVPYGFDRETYFNHLSKMEDQGKLVDFEDNCDKSGFRFTVKLDGEQDKKCQSDPLSYFKLEKSVTENYTTLDEFGKLKIFDNKQEIVKYFCDYRLTKFAEKLKYDENKLNEEISWLSIKMQFIMDVSSNKIELKTQKKSQWLEDIPKFYNCSKESANNLLNISVVDMTEDYISNLKNKIKDKKSQLEELLKLNAKEVFLSKLKVII